MGLFSCFAPKKREDGPASSNYVLDKEDIQGQKVEAKQQEVAVKEAAPAMENGKAGHATVDASSPHPVNPDASLLQNMLDPEGRGCSQSLVGVVRGQFARVDPSEGPS